MAKQDKSSKSEPVDVVSERAPIGLELALDVATRGHTTVVAILQDARIEVRTAVDGTIDLGEKLADGVVRFARKLVVRLDTTTSDALSGTERALGDAIERARTALRTGRQLADKALDKVSAAA